MITPERLQLLLWAVKEIETKGIKKGLPKVNERVGEDVAVALCMKQLRRRIRSTKHVPSLLEIDAEVISFFVQYFAERSGKFNDDDPLKTIAGANFPLVIPDIFFNAMRAGYAGGAKAVTGSELPGSRTITHQGGDWEVVDTYFVTPQGPSSGGTTVISYCGIPVWMMQYMGEYPSDALPCLKAALRSTYTKGVFVGGRGPKRFAYHELTYVNNVAENSTFNKFSGEEHIFVPMTGNVLGQHTYQGMLMIT